MNWLKLIEWAVDLAGWAVAVFMIGVLAGAGYRLAQLGWGGLFV